MAAGRAVLVSRDDGGGQRVHTGRSGEGHARSGVRPCQSGGSAVHRVGAHVHGRTASFQEIEFAADGRSISFQAAGRWQCDVQGLSARRRMAALRRVGGGGAVDAVGAAAAVRSPRCSRRTRSMRHSFAIQSLGCDTATNKESPLTTDGIKDFGYATDNAGWASSNRRSCCGPTIRSGLPPSSRISAASERCTGEHDGRASDAAGVEVPLPGDQVVTTIQRVVLDLDGPRTVRLKCRPTSTARRFAITGVPRREWADVQWDKDGANLAYVSTSRDHKEEVLRIANATTGEVRDVLRECRRSSNGQWTGELEVPAGVKEILWFSERDNWGHLYLYDSETGS